MKRRLVVAVSILAVISGAVRADEGMWMPEQLAGLAGELEARGLELDPATLADVSDGPLAAVVWLGGCSASFVSPEGLVITNHHCAYRSIQHNSTAGANLLRDGFLARSRADELPAVPGSRAFVILGVDDVSSRIHQSVPAGVTGLEHTEAEENAVKALVAQCEDAPGISCRVEPFYGGVRWLRFRQLEIRDLRLVHAPPGSIGNYGGDVDNWMWPRHTGDYSFYRAYVGPDGQPAEPAPENVPYRPSRWLEVSTDGAGEGELVLVAGFPGSTDRHRLALEVEHVIRWYYPTRTRLYREWLELIDAAVAGDEGTTIAYASTVAGLNNSAKNNEGMLVGFQGSDIVARKRAFEEQLQLWIDADPARSARWGSALATLREAVERQHAWSELRYRYELFDRQAQLLGAARLLLRLGRERTRPDAEREPGFQTRDERGIRSKLERIDRSYLPRVDRAVWRHFLLGYASQSSAARVAALDRWLAVDDGPAALDRKLDELYAGTRLGDRSVRLGWMTADPAAFEASDDPFIRLALALEASDRAAERADKQLSGDVDAARHPVMEALLAFFDERGVVPYPDANGTLRVTFGTVRGYSPRDAVSYRPFTTVAGILEKDTGADPFDAPPAQLEAIRARRFGRWADPRLGTLPVDFLSTVDTTGGNSGSATLDRHGRLVGLLFDGNWESIVSDWDFLPAVTRSIHVDIRYVVWVMEELEGADRLLVEMGIRPDPEPPRPGG